MSCVIPLRSGSGDESGLAASPFASSVPCFPFLHRVPASMADAPDCGGFASGALWSRVAARRMSAPSLSRRHLRTPSRSRRRTPFPCADTLADCASLPSESPPLHLHSQPQPAKVGLGLGPVPAYSRGTDAQRRRLLLCPFLSRWGWADGRPSRRQTPSSLRLSISATSLSMTRLR